MREKCPQKFIQSRDERPPKKKEKKKKACQAENLKGQSRQKLGQGKKKEKKKKKRSPLG